MTSRRRARAGTLGGADLGVLPAAIEDGPKISVWAPDEEPSQAAAHRAWRAWRDARNAWAAENGMKPHDVPTRTSHPY